MQIESSVSTSVLPTPLSMGAILSLPEMRRLWYAQIVSTFGDFLALFAVIGELTFRMKATPQQITGLQIAYLLPATLVGILAGVLVDRWPLKITLVGSDLIRAVLVLLFLVAHSVLHFYGILVFISVVSSFFGPAQGVAIRSTVPPHGLRSANALMQQVTFGMRILGPAIGACMVASLGPMSCYLADAASFFASACLLATIGSISMKGAFGRTEVIPELQKPAFSSIIPDMRQGMQFIAHHTPVLFVILALASGMFIVGCFGPLIAVYVRDSLHAPAWVFGIASAMIGIGMLGGVPALNAWGKGLSNETLIFAGLGGIAIGLCVLTGIMSVIATMVANLIIGFAVVGLIVPANTMIQQETPASMMGRVGSIAMSVVFTAQICGLVLSGVLADSVGVRRVFAGCAILLVVLIIVGKRVGVDGSQPERIGS